LVDDISFYWKMLFDWALKEQPLIYLLQPLVSCLFSFYIFGLREELAQFCFVSGLVWLV